MDGEDILVGKNYQEYIQETVKKTDPIEPKDSYCGKGGRVVELVEKKCPQLVIHLRIGIL